MSAHKIDFDFELQETVNIIPLDCQGKITALFVCEDGIQYRVRYFYDGNARNEFFFRSELR